MQLKAKTELEAMGKLLLSVLEELPVAWMGKVRSFSLPLEDLESKLFLPTSAGIAKSVAAIA